MKHLLVLAALLVSGCGVLDQNYETESPRQTRLAEAMRHKYGIDQVIIGDRINDRECRDGYRVVIQKHGRVYSGKACFYTNWTLYLDAGSVLLVDGSKAPEAPLAQ